MREGKAYEVKLGYNFLLGMWSVLEEVSIEDDYRQQYAQLVENDQELHAEFKKQNDIQLMRKELEGKIKERKKIESDKKLGRRDRRKKIVVS